MKVSGSAGGGTDPNTQGTGNEQQAPPASTTTSETQLEGADQRQQTASETLPVVSEDSNQPLDEPQEQPPPYESVVSSTYVDNAGNVHDGNRGDVESVVSASGEPEFPVKDLQKLDDSLNKTKWVVPVTPGGELEILLSAAIDLCKRGLDTRSEPCQRFFREGLQSSFCKLMMDDAVTSWKSEIHQYIYDNSMKLIELCVAKLADDWFPLLELLAMVLNGNNRFHQVNQREQAKTLPRDGSTSSEIVYAEPHEHYNKGWLVDFVNTVGDLRGFEILHERIVKGSNLTVPVMAALLKPFAGCTQVLSVKCVETYLLPCCDRVLEVVETLTDDDLKKEAKSESKSDSLSSIVKSLKVLYQHVPHRRDMLEEIETFRLKMILRLLQISSFGGKMNALNEVNRLIQSVYSYSGRSMYDDEETGLTADRLADWIQQNSVLSIVLKDNLHQPQYVERLEKILWFMIRQKALSQDDLDILWAAQVDKHEAIVKNIHDLLARLAWNFSAEQLDYLFQCFQKSWTHAGKRQREKLIELIRRLAEDDKEGVMAVKVLGLLWNLAHSEDCPKEIMEQALTAHIKILDYSCAADRDQQKTHWLVRCIEELKGDAWVLPAIKMIHDIFSMYFEGPSNMSVHSHHNLYYRQEIINHFEQHHRLIDLVTDNLGLYIEKARKYTEANPSTEPSELMVDGRVSHEQQVTERLNFLRFILKDGQLYLPLSAARTIWHWLAEKAVFPCDREAAFRWFSKVMGEDPDLEPDVGRPFFEEQVLQIDPTDVTESGMKCFERAFTMVNQREQKLVAKRHHRVTNDLSLVGLEYLWKLFLHASDDIALRAIEIVKNVYTNLGPALEPKQVTIHRQFIQKCFSFLHESYDTLSALRGELDANGRDLVNQHSTRMVRCLTLLREYIAECDATHEDERAILPHGKSWLGRHMMWTVRFPMPSGRPEDIEVTTHGNESLAAVRRKIIRLRRGSSQSSRLDLYVNGELVNPVDDKKLITQLPFRDKQMVTAKLSHTRHAASPSQDSSSDSSTNSASNPFEGPNIEAEQSLPGVIISREANYCGFLLTVGQLGIQFNVPSLRDSVRHLLELIPTDQGAVSKIRQCSAEATVNGMSELRKLCFELPPLNTLYHLEVVHSMLMPASSFEEEQAQQFQVWFFENGGISLLLSLLKEGKFMREADNTTRRSAYSVCVKLGKLMLCSLGFAKVATWTRAHQRGEKLSQSDHEDLQRIHQALHQLPGLQSDVLIRTIASRLGQMTNEESVKSLALPSLETIHAIQRLAWAASAGMINLVHGTPAEIHASHDRAPGTGRAVEPECSTIAKEALEVLSVCLAVCPDGHESLTRDVDWKLFITDMLLMTRTRSVRIAACDQFYLMVTRCSTDSRPLTYFIVLLFAGLETDVVKRAKMSNEYFTLLCRLLSYICQTREITVSVDHRLNLEIQWLKDVKAKFESSGGPVVEDSLLEGHLNVMKELLAFKTSEERQAIGSAEGQGLINELVKDFLCPASDLLLLAKKTNGPLPSEPVKAICSSLQTQQAAYDLLVALCAGCVANLEELCHLQEELFYKDNAIPLVEWEFSPPVGPRPIKGFVGLKNAGATCYMNSVVQMLYMIPEIRNYILKVEDLWKETEEEETSFVEEKNLKNQQLNERSESDQEPKNNENPTLLPSENQEEDRNTYRVAVVKQIQCIFGHLMKSRLQYYTPRGLWKSFRMQDRPVNVREQQDAMEFFNGIVDGVDEGLKAIDHEQIAVKVMGGVFADQKICKGCPHRYAKEEPFMSISVDIRHHQHLLESLEQYVKGDLLEGDNAYFCEKCGKKVDTIKRTCIQKLPPVLVIQLKRFDYDWERDCAVKFNDYIEFPRELDMEPYTVQGLAKLEGETVDVNSGPDTDEKVQEKDEACNSCTRYRLAGIVVHSGQASGGHYYSYIAQRVEGQTTKWFKFEDGDVGEARMEDEDELKNQCFGGEFMGETYDHVMKRMQYRRQKRWWNAYLLFYEREDMPFTVVVTDSPPAPVLPGAIERAVQRENLEYSHTKAQFGVEYFRFIKSLAQSNVPLVTDDRPDITEAQELLVMLVVKLLTKFLFSVGLRTKKMIRGSALEWSTTLLTLLRCSKNVRFWFATHALFERPERFSEFLLECPSQEVRSSFSKLIAYLAHYSLDDGPYSRPFPSPPSYDVATTPQMIETPPPVTETHTLSDCLLDAALSLMKKEVGEHDKHLQQYFQLFLTYANQGNAERSQLLRMRVPSLFISMSLGDGPVSLGYRHHTTDFTKLHSVISLLVRCCDVSQRLKSVHLNTTLYENPFCETMEPAPLHPDLDQAIFVHQKYIKKVIVESTGSEDTIKLLRFCCWENPMFSRTVLTELLFQLSYVYSYELKPYLDLLLHILLIEDSWQQARILNTIRGFRDEQAADGLVEVIQRGRSHYQKRAYQCIKMMVILFNSCRVANELLQKDSYLKRQWQSAVVWLAEELERRPYGHTYGYNNWSPPAQSNETSNGYFLERSNSAKQTLARAYELCPVEEQPDESETMDESPQDRDSPISQSGGQYGNDAVPESAESNHRRRPESPVSPSQVKVTQTGPSTRIELRKTNKTKSVDNLDQIEDFAVDPNVQETVSLQPMDED